MVRAVARTKEFDPDAVLQRAMELFWSRGYEATSMADLVEHLRVARASIYATFGGKHDLYLKALERYVQTRDPNVVAVLSQPGPSLPAVRTLVEETALTSALIRAQAQGELPADRDPQALARFLLVLLQGMRVLGRTRPDPARLRDAAQQALASLR
jgi:TetR/AcrR family transcriptional repressor of nem operon